MRLYITTGTPRLLAIYHFLLGLLSCRIYKLAPNWCNVQFSFPIYFWLSKAILRCLQRQGREYFQMFPAWLELPAQASVNSNTKGSVADNKRTLQISWCSPLSETIAMARTSQGSQHPSCHYNAQSVQPTMVISFQLLTQASLAKQEIF